MLKGSSLDRVRVGVIGLRHGSQIHVAAFRNDCRSEVVALAGRDAAKTAAMARAIDVRESFGDWRELVAAPDIDAISIAVPPAIQPEIISEACQKGKHVFCEKPVGASVADAQRALQSAEAAGVAHGIDFIFPEIVAWQRTRTLLEEGAIGRPTHFAYSWRVETYASLTNANTWKNHPNEGGGVLGNFVSHVFFNLEWLFGSIQTMKGFVCSADGRAADGVLEFINGVTGSVSVRTDAFLGSGHRLEIYGEEGTLVLHNRTTDYGAGFDVSLGTRSSGELAAVSTQDGVTQANQVDGRVAPTTRLVGRFLDAVCGRGTMTPNLVHGLRIQELVAVAGRGPGSFDVAPTEPKR